MARVFIYGGCVSRDAVRYYPSYGMELIDYVSRQSLPSVFAPAKLRDLRIPSSFSGFQRRMIKGDIQSSLPSLLAAQAPEIDLLVWDLNIERVGFSQLSTGGIFTRNGAQIDSESSAVADTFPFGTDRHFELWKIALESFVNLLRDNGLLDRTLINATPWATHAAVPASASRWNPVDFNASVLRYWEQAAEAGIQVVRIPSKEVVADPSHKWGPAYFHYRPQTYKTQVKLIAQTAGLKRVRRLPIRTKLDNIFSRHV